MCVQSRLSDLLSRISFLAATAANLEALMKESAISTLSGLYLDGTGYHHRKCNSQAGNAESAIQVCPKTDKPGDDDLQLYPPSRESQSQVAGHVL